MRELEWLVQWASSHQLAIASTIIEKHVDEQWTYEKSCNQRQLDYCLMDVSLISWAQGVLACNDIGVGENRCNDIATGEGEGENKCNDIGESFEDMVKK